jgi:hypothetical protein
MKLYRDNIDMYLSELGYLELVQRLFEKITFFLVDPLRMGTTADAATSTISKTVA